MVRRGHIFSQIEKVKVQDMQKPGLRRKHRIAYSTQKGGATKTTETLNCSIAASLCGKRVLAVDWDHGQGNLTYAFGYTPYALENSGYTAMLGESSLAETILPTYFDPKTGIFFDPGDPQKMERLGLTSLAQAVRGPDLLPMNPNHCEGTEQSLVVKRGDWGLLLDRLLGTAEEDYAEFYIDTNPDIQSIYPKIAANAATHIVIPSTPENWAVQGWIMYARFLMQIRIMNPDVSICGILFTRLKYAAHKEILQASEEEIIPAVNDLFTQVRESYLRTGRAQQAKQLEGLHLVSFQSTVGESKEYSTQTNRRATVMTSPKKAKPEFTPALEQWQCYIELLKRIEGSGSEEAINHYNRLVEQYENAPSR